MQQGFELFASHEILSVSLNGAAGTQSKRCLKKPFTLSQPTPERTCATCRNTPRQKGRGLRAMPLHVLAVVTAVGLHVLFVVTALRAMILSQAFALRTCHCRRSCVWGGHAIGGCGACGKP